MELKAGYKQTEIGVIPDDWEVVPLGELISSVDYGSSAKSNSQGPIPVLRMGNIQNGEIDWHDLVYSNDEYEIKKYNLNAGDVLFNRTNTIDLVGKTAIYKAERPAIFAGYLIRIKVDKALLCPEYLNFVLNTEFAKKHSAKVLSIAVGQANINSQKLKTYPIPIPPNISEQRAIAAALSDMDALLAKLDALIAKKRDLKQATMQQLLTAQTRLPGFSDEWEVKRIDAIATVGRGRVISHKEITASRMSQYPVYSSQTSNHGIMGYIDTNDFEGEYITWTTDGEKAGTAFYRNGKFNCTNVCGTLKLHSDNTIFVAYILKQQMPKYVSRNLANPKLMNDVVKKIFITIPSEIEEQTAIATVLSDIDAEITTLEARRDKTHALKQGMMQELLTGKIRLI